MPLGLAAEELQASRKRTERSAKRSAQSFGVLEIEELGRSAKAVVAAVADFVADSQYTVVVAAVPERSAAGSEEDIPCIAAVREHC